MDPLSTAGRLVRLANQFGVERLEAACQKALAYGDVSFKTVKGIPKQGTEGQIMPLSVAIPPAITFARSTAELVGELLRCGRGTETPACPPAPPASTAWSGGNHGGPPPAAH